MSFGGIFERAPPLVDGPDSFSPVSPIRAWPAFSGAPAFSAAARAVATELNLALQIVDAEVLFDGAEAILQFIARSDFSLDAFIEALQARSALKVRLENLALDPAERERSGSGGCGKPDCGKVDAGGGCSTCGTGGCGTCGSGSPDLRPYFAHLRQRMDDNARTPLC